MSDDAQFDGGNGNGEYEGVQWIGDSVTARTKKTMKKLTRDDHLYGVFVEDNYSDTDDLIGPRKNRKLAQETEFVSSGLYQPGSEGSEHIEVKIAQPKPTKEEASQGKEPAEKEDSLPTSFGQKIEAGALRRKTAEREKEEAKEAWKEAQKSGFAAFEQHSRGVASKLMQKMGYKPGEGLGARKQGMVEPIIQKLRPKSMGMGYGDFKEQRAESEIQLEDQMEVEGEVTKKPKAPRLWRKQTVKDRAKRHFKTAAEVIKDSEEAYVEPVNEKIIDMRNAQTKILTDFSQISQEPMDDEKPLPELAHNMELLVDLTENEIRTLDSKLKSKEDSAILLERQQTDLSTELISQSDHLKKLKDLHQRLMMLEDSKHLDAEALLAEAVELKSTYPTEYVQYNVAAIILQRVVPYFEVLFRNWNPFKEDIKYGFHDIGKWKCVLDCQECHDFEASLESLDSNAYAQLLIHAFLPPLRSVIINEWNPRIAEPLLSLMEQWKELLPYPILSHVCGFLILSKMKDSLEMWDPCKDTVPLHVWIHPWLPLMSHNLTELYPIIITKLINALQAWHASDSSALVLLSPWKSVFTEEEWEHLTKRAILPKLAQALQHYEVNPLQHDLEPIKWITQWKEVIPQQHLTSLLDSLFFPKWLRILHHWLEHQPNYEEISTWYSSWKSVFPEEMQQSEQVASRFRAALTLMNTAVDGRTLPTVDYVLGSSKTQPRTTPVLPVASKTIFTLRDLVQRFAEDNNISFLPKGGRMHEGFQIYGFGMVSITLDNSQNTVKAQIGGIWKALSLEELFVETQNRQSAL